MIKCLYVAGTLFISNGGAVTPVGPVTEIDDLGPTVGVFGQYRNLVVGKYDPDQSIEEFLLQCDAEASELSMQRMDE